MSSTPYIGGLIGAILGGFVSDRIFRGRRKPAMLMTAVMMAILLITPNSTALLAIVLILAGFFLNIGWSGFTSFAMNITTNSTYPFAISIINSGGNLGGFFAQLIVGALLDATHNYTVAFSYFVLILVLAFFILLTLTEFKPAVEPRKDEAVKVETAAE
ncbi:MFS transporter [Bifidobacterium asteroides]|uniref:MFS transporter n=1 Tax=Bifidobacterium asteroides TaxID=1684 RepID=UPI001C645470|nr:MFS transporter [Bifidobacterium asteroides]